MPSYFCTIPKVLESQGRYSFQHGKRYGNDTETIPDEVEVVDVSKYQPKNVPSLTWRESTRAPPLQTDIPEEIVYAPIADVGWGQNVDASLVG